MPGRRLVSVREQREPDGYNSEYCNSRPVELETIFCPGISQPPELRAAAGADILLIWRNPRNPHQSPLLHTFLLRADSFGASRGSLCALTQSIACI